MERGSVLIVFFILIIACFISSFEVGKLSHSIQMSYGPSENIKGWINISLENEHSDSLFEDGEGHSISLINLIKKNTGFVKTCVPENCESDYVASNPEEIKVFDLGEGDSALFGFKLGGEITSITSAGFTLSSNVEQYCTNQLEIDIKNDGKKDIENNKALESPKCDDVLKKYGCFDDTKETKWATLNDKPFCQRIKITESPGFWMGAWVKEETAGTKKLTIELYDISGEAIEKCELPKEEIAGTEGEIFCSIDYSALKSEDYYVCIYSDEGDGDYKIKNYLDGEEGCGFWDWPTGGNLEGAAYKIFIEGKRFDAIGEIGIQNDLPYGSQTFSELIQDYLTQNYGISGGYIDCVSGCVVPIKLTAKKSQQITLSGLKVIYNERYSGQSEENNFYEIQKTSALVNADIQKLYLDEGNFSVSSKFGNYTFKLKLGGKEIFTEKVWIAKVPQILGLRPKATAAAYPTEFQATIDFEGNVSEYNWDFGDNSTKKTSTNKISHTYSSEGTYLLKVTATSSDQRSASKIFQISVGSPKEIVDKLLKKGLGDLANVKKQIKEFPTFSQKSIETAVGILDLETKLGEIQQLNASASTGGDYGAVLTELLSIDVPESISTSISADSISFFPDSSFVDLEILEEIGGGEYNQEDEEKYIESIFGWNQNNMNTKLNFKEISATYESFEKPILKIFEFDIEKDSEEVPYLILRQVDDIQFKSDYSEKSIPGYIYFKLGSSQTEFVFSTTEDITFTDLPLFISPAISELSLTGGSSKRDEQLLKLALFVLIIFLLIIVGVIVYIILHEWYKKKYESYLFKNKNDLYNLVSYVQSSKKKGLKDKEIVGKLKKAGWKSEQVDFVIRKYLGKRTGMPEIPVGKVLQKLKAKENLSRKNPVGNELKNQNYFESGLKNKKRL